LGVPAKSVLDNLPTLQAFLDANGATEGQRLALFSNLWNALDEFRRETDAASQLNDPQQRFIVQVASGTGVAFSAGLVMWVLRGGALAASLLATLPSWAAFDPIPVLSVRRRQAASGLTTHKPLGDATERAVGAVFRPGSVATRVVPESRS
jgi:hypothetical protein